MSTLERRLPLFLTRDEAVHLALELGVRTWADLDDADRLSYSREIRAREELRRAIADLLTPPKHTGPDPRD